MDRQCCQNNLGWFTRAVLQMLLGFCLLNLPCLSRKWEKSSVTPIYVSSLHCVYRFKNAKTSIWAFGVKNASILAGSRKKATVWMGLVCCWWRPSHIPPDLHTFSNPRNRLPGQFFKFVSASLIASHLFVTWLTWDVSDSEDFEHREQDVKFSLDHLSSARRYYRKANMRCWLYWISKIHGDPLHRLSMRL